MPMFRKKPVVIEAHQWFKNGDHPQDRVGKQELDVIALEKQHPEIFDHPSGEVGPVPEDSPTYTRQEGAVVRYFRHPDVKGTSQHNVLADTARPNCRAKMDDHGWIDTIEGGHTVCPGDWIITGVQGERYPCEPSIFAATYEPVDDGSSHGLDEFAGGDYQ